MQNRPNARARNKYREHFGTSAIFKQGGGQLQRADYSGLGMRLLMVLHRTFCKMGMSMKLVFLGLDFSKTNKDVR